MDIIAQLQDQANKIAYVAFNTVGSLQRDAPAARLASTYPEPPVPPPEVLAAKNEEPKTAAVSFVQAVKQVCMFTAIFLAFPSVNGPFAVRQLCSAFSIVRLQCARFFSLDGRESVC